MKKTTPFALLFLCASLFYLSAQDQSEVLRAFQRNFVRGNLTTKIQVLQDASDETDVDMGPLFLQALDFVIDNSAILSSSPVDRELTILAVRLVGISGYRESLDLLWDLFILDSNTSIRIEIFSAIADLLPPEPSIVQKLNRWVINQNAAFKNEELVDQAVLSEAAITLGVLADKSSFPVLFSMGTVGYPETISLKARDALYKIEGDFTELIERVIRDNPAADKLEALRIAVDNENLRDSEKATIAESALDKALSMNPRNANEREYQRRIRYESIRVLAEYGWSDATDDVIDHFGIVLAEYAVGTARLTHVLEAIDALGAMGTHEAAVRLTLYLQVLNSDVENGKKVEEQIVLDVMRNLGNLGDKDAFEDLLLAGYLDYSERVKRTAREALDKL